MKQPPAATVGQEGPVVAASLHAIFSGDSDFGQMAETRFRSVGRCKFSTSDGWSC